MSFDELVKKLSPTLKRITYKLNGYYYFLSEDDLFQEAVIHLWEDFNAGKLKDKTDSYILQGCYFYLKNYLRKVKSARFTVSLDGLISDKGDNFEEFVFLKEESQHDCFNYLNDKMLAEAIMNNGLTGREKEILGFFSDGLTTREIGGKIGISHVRVVKLMHRIREKCKKHLD